ncbi:hypothetical protein EV702DRAFT_1060200 [Suillus placidus]|uniref:Uncharacterized protein n=1 Tax=Suillus placidus TaxID=48579 RepID=A0A9P7D937_9AGAM|nr:hypothetical protein EV702DRAFT_1060200 [Suillus placidus]
MALNSGIKDIHIEKLQNYIPIIMCYWRRVRNYYKGCGHSINLPDEEIKCDLRNCKFSPKHSPTCIPPQCSKVCWQYRQYPQQYAPQIDKRCPKCNIHG